MAYTYKGDVLTSYLVKKLKDNYQTVKCKRRDDIYYCDQEFIPNHPSIMVEPARVVRTLSGTGQQTANEFFISILIYGADVRGVQNAQQDADAHASLVADFLTTDGQCAPVGTQFGGLVVHGYVQSSDYGYIFKRNKLHRANRLMVFALSKTSLVES